MKTAVQFAEYSITGGILLLNLVLFATLISLDLDHQQTTLANALGVWQEWLDQLARITKPLEGKPAIQSGFDTVLAALSIILIFCTGLLLDLTAPLFFTPIEMVWIKRWLASSDRAWLEKLVQRHSDLVGDNYRSFVDGPMANWLLPHHWQVQRNNYNRLRSFLFSYLHVHASDACLEDFNDQYHLWHTSRAISTSMIFLGVLLTLYVGDPGQAVLISLGIPLLLFALSSALTLTTHSRLCMTLCSLLYLSDKGATTRAPASEAKLLQEV